MADGVIELNLDDLNPFEGDRSILLAESESGLWKGLIIDLNETTLTPDGILAIYDNRIVVADSGALGTVSLIGDITGSGLLGSLITTTLSAISSPLSLNNRQTDLNYPDTAFKEYGSIHTVPDSVTTDREFSNKYVNSGDGRYWKAAFNLGLSPLKPSFSISHWDAVNGLSTPFEITEGDPLDRKTTIRTDLDLDENSLKNFLDFYPKDPSIRYHWPSYVGAHNVQNDIPEDAVNNREFVNHYNVIDGAVEKRKWYTSFELGLPSPLSNFFRLNYWDAISGAITPIEVSTEPTEYITLQTDSLNLNATNINLTGSTTTFNSAVDLNNNTIVNGRAEDPTGGVDTAIATKKYVDDNSGGGGGGGIVELYGAVIGAGEVGTTITTDLAGSIGLSGGGSQHFKSAMGSFRAEAGGMWPGTAQVFLFNVDPMPTGLHTGDSIKQTLFFGTPRSLNYPDHNSSGWEMVFRTQDSISWSTSSANFEFQWRWINGSDWILTKVITFTNINNGSAGKINFFKTLDMHGNSINAPAATQDNHPIIKKQHDEALEKMYERLNRLENQLKNKQSLLSRIFKKRRKK